MAARECDEAMMRAEIADISTPLVIDVHAPWCKFCKLMDPHLARIAEERAGTLRVAKIDNDEHAEMGIELGVRTLPLVILMKDGKEVARRGSGNYEELTAWLTEHGL